MQDSWGLSRRRLSLARQEGSTACCPGKRAGPKGGLAERGALLPSLADDMTKEVLEEVATRQWRGWGKFPALIVTLAPTVVRVPPTVPDVVERRSITLRLSAYGFDILVPLPFSRRKAAARCHALRQASTPAAATRRWTNGPGRVTYCRCGLSRKQPLNFGRHPCQPGRGAAGQRSGNVCLEQPYGLGGGGGYLVLVPTIRDPPILRPSAAPPPGPHLPCPAPGPPRAIPSVASLRASASRHWLERRGQP